MQSHLQNLPQFLVIHAVVLLFGESFGELLTDGLGARLAGGVAGWEIEPARRKAVSSATTLHPSSVCPSHHTPPLAPTYLLEKDNSWKGSINDI